MQVPYVHFETYKNVEKMKREIANTRKTHREKTEPTEKATNFPKTSIEVIKNCLYSDLPVHCRRTLSQYYYHSRLQRPKQFVTEHFLDFWPSDDPLTLMVDQLWMLILADGMNLLGYLVVTDR